MNRNNKKIKRVKQRNCGKGINYCIVHTHFAYINISLSFLFLCQFYTLIQSIFARFILFLYYLFFSHFFSNTRLIATPLIAFPSFSNFPNIVLKLFLFFLLFFPEIGKQKQPKILWKKLKRRCEMTNTPEFLNIHSLDVW